MVNWNVGIGTGSAVGMNIYKNTTDAIASIENAYGYVFIGWLNSVPGFGYIGLGVKNTYTTATTNGTTIWTYNNSWYMFKIVSYKVSNEDTINYNSIDSKWDLYIITTYTWANASGAIHFWPNSSSNESIIDKDGNVGIGTATPTEQFQVSDYAWIGQDNITNSSTTGWSFLRLYGHVLWLSKFWPKYSPNIQLNYYSNISSEYYNRQIDNDGDKLNFNFATGNYDYDTKVSITDNGSVGIGTTSPQGKLDVTTDSTKFTMNEVNDFGWYAGFTMQAWTSPWLTWFNIRKFAVWNTWILNNWGSITIWASSNINENMFLTTWGKVGIGTHAPSAKLTVEGGIQAKTLIVDPCSDTTNYPEGTMFYVPAHTYSGSINLPDMYCFCDSKNIARPINGVYVNVNRLWPTGETIDRCFKPN